MSVIDWSVLGLVLALIVIYGIVKTRNQSGVSDFVTGGKKASWWTIGLSVMATQASAITFLSTPGQAFHDGMGFVQFYFGLPIAMIVISIYFVPIYYRLKVFTAYTYLEKRFDVSTRTLTAVFFLIQRGLAAGITIFAPSIILSAILGWDLFWLNIMIGCLVILYTVTGGTRAVNITQKQQMAVIFGGMLLTFLMLLNFLPLEIGIKEALNIAGTQGKMNLLDFSLDFENRYTFWSGIIGGSFLALSYFGTDQSQVQRYLSGRSIRQSQMGLIMNGLLKVPMQFFILLIGILVFVFYQFNDSPLNFNPTNEKAVLNSTYAKQYRALNHDKTILMGQIETLQLEYINLSNSPKKIKIGQDISNLNQQQLNLRQQAKDLIKAVDADLETNDKDYVFIHFILTQLPMGLIGLLLAVILSAAMSSTASEINALGTTSAIDLYQRHRPGHSEAHYLKTARYFTLLWGVIAIIVACTAPLFDNLIQLVNIIGSIFYGNILGVFISAFFIKAINGQSIFLAAIINQILIITLFFLNLFSVIKLPYLWLNVIGCVLVILIALIFEMLQKKPNSN